MKKKEDTAEIHEMHDTLNYWKDPNYLRERLPTLTIAQITSLIRRDWKKVYFGAVPYLDAMSTLDYLDPVTCHYGVDSGVSIVLYFLANANTWRGEVARAVKKELNRRVK